MEKMRSFIQYSDIILEGFSSNPKSIELVSKKRDLLLDILGHDDLSNRSILFVGFSPWCLSNDLSFFTITEVSSSVTNYLDQKQCQYKHSDLVDLLKETNQFDVVIAADEYFTFAENDIDQRNLVDQLAQLTKGTLITTLRDYKNQDFKDREFSQPIMIRGAETNKMFVEHYEYDIKDKNSSLNRIYVVDNNNNSKIHGPYIRRNMYFKQLAKFSMDAGAKEFYVHKNLMYKSVIKKNYEHVITIRF